MLRFCLYAFLAGSLIIFINACQQAEPEKEAPIKNQKAAELLREQFAGRLKSVGNKTLSEYGFFTGRLADMQASKGIIPYDINTPLFSDYAYKARFIKVPDNLHISYKEQDVLDLPVGTFLIKTFYYPDDFRDPEGKRRLIETRVMQHETDGWTTLAYVWNKEQTEAYLEIAGISSKEHWINNDGRKMNVDYIVPSMAQCKSCHLKNDKISPIGPSVRQLNKDFDYRDGKENQLIHWQKAGILSALPLLSSVPKTPVWDKPSSGSLHERAMAYLDINCGHCHREEGQANTSGLHLMADEADPFRLGIMKKPVAAGKGTGGRLFNIVPGKPDESILVYRMESTDPGEMMPEVGRKLVHKEGVELVREWISKLK